MNSRFPLRLAQLAALPMAVALPLAAQTAAPSAPSEPKEEALMLAPFQVTSEGDIGYVANDTLAGSRMRTNLSDVANAISVFTPEFMNDVLAFGENDLLRYSSSAIPERTEQSPNVQGIDNFAGQFQARIRGQKATRSRNYFETNLLPDTCNMDHFEEARDLNSILFGLGGAGGLLNASTKQALLNRNVMEVNVVAGSWNQRRATIDHNQKLTRQVALRINGVLETADGWHAGDIKDNRRIAGALTYRPFETVTIRLEGEMGEMTDSVTRSYTASDFVSLWAANGRTLLPEDWAAIESSPYPYEASFFGPGRFVEQTQGTYSASIEVEPVKNLFIEAAFNHDERTHHFYDSNNNVMQIRGEPARTYRDGSANPYAGQYYLETFPVLRYSAVDADRWRMTAAYTLDLGKVGRHNLAVLWSADDSTNPRSTSFLAALGAPFNANPTAVQNRIWVRQYIQDPGDPASWSVPDWRTVPKQISVSLSAGLAAVTYDVG